MKKHIYAAVLLLSLSLPFVSCERVNKQTDKKENTKEETSQKETVEPEKTIEFIDNELNDIKETVELEKTIEFIKNEINDIEGSLAQAEMELMDFRQKNDLTNLDLQTNQVYTNLCALDKERAEITVNLKIYKRMQDYIKVKIDNPENLASPSTMGIGDPLINKLAYDLVSLSQTKATKLLTQTEQQPEIMKLNEQIVTTKKALLETINNLVDNTQLSLNEIDRRINSLEMESRQLPSEQQQLIKYQRNFDFMEDVYMCLAKRRLEAEILLASAIPDYEKTETPKTPIKETSVISEETCKSILNRLYNDYVFGSRYDQFDQVVDEFFTAKAKQKLIDAYDYDCDGVCYAIWSLRTEGQDGKDGADENRVDRIVQIQDNAYEVQYVDMGWHGHTLFLFALENGNVKIDDYVKTMDETVD